ncbi:MAG: hypothetical protein ALECFALPRED_005966 [Alectoria fallacina]|uniref:DBF4-type domain-containing protein n=1 Tax=Alectoria fallacina TaxID=1903189 RepID=A0A8H3EN23_9LECA|nr:MAG: hypothetical protein ALECFALPRED_005966 [Alectoria fallacina]
MSSRRVPLGDVPNAANSPFRSVAAATSKRSRDQIDAQEDLAYVSQPRAKRQALEDGRTNLRTSPRKQALQSVESRVFNKQLLNAQPTPFERKLLASAKEHKGVQRIEQKIEQRVQQRVERQGKASHEALEDIRQWQRHYKKSFPTFVFYFESLPEEVRVKCSKWVRSLGAREEKFFSKEVTHVVTTRPIPSDHDLKDGNDLFTPPSASTSSQATAQPRTINPSLLDPQHESRGQPLQRNKFTFEVATSKKTGFSGLSDVVESRKINSGNTDILLKAKEMGIKLWQLEKLSRVVNSMFDVPNETQAHNGTATRSRGINAATRVEREPDLSRMLRNERLNGPSDRDPTVALSELIPFKGPFLYIRDIDERTKPIMVKDYPRPATQEEGEWPQFRYARAGRCPFVEDPSRQELEAETRAGAEELAIAKAETRTAPRTRATAIREDADTDAAIAASKKRPLEEKKNMPNTFVPPPAKMPQMRTHDFCPPPTKPRSPTKAARDMIAIPGPKLFGGEPAASGLQQSNITSAIRSQMISSTAAAPGAKAGTSKEVHGLKRKVLEKNTRPPFNSIQTRQRNVDPAGTARAERNIPMARQNRRQAPETLVHIDEESTQSEEDEDIWLAEDLRRKEKELKKAVDEKELKGKDLKEGYCENCRKKYEHFDDVGSSYVTPRDYTDGTTQHIISNQHRRFALTDANWADLDKLLSHLGRRLKEPDCDGF